VKWPVCGRCSGLYLGGPIGAVAAVSLSRRRCRPAARRSPNRWIRNPNVTLVGLASLPTVVTVLAEVTGLLPVSTLARAAAAVPLGAAIAFVIVRVLAEPLRPIEYTLAE
jgi:hypothetical protein